MSLIVPKSKRAISSDNVDDVYPINIQSSLSFREDTKSITRKTNIVNVSCGSVLSDRDILDQISEGNIVIYPYNEQCLSNCSYDVTLGRNYFRHTQDLKKVLNPWSETHSLSYWGSALKALKADTKTAEEYDLKVGDEYIFLNAGETILGHTNEFIGGRRFVTTSMKARSSVGRLNVSVCRDAGWGDIGYVNRWTMEIQNFGTTAVVLPVGVRIGQIIFHRSTIPNKTYSVKGNYQNGDDLDKLINNWSPDCMLPKLYLDKFRLVPDDK